MLGMFEVVANALAEPTSYVIPGATGATIGGFYLFNNRKNAQNGNNSNGSKTEVRVLKEQVRELKADVDYLRKKADITEQNQAKIMADVQFIKGQLSKWHN